MRADAVGDVEFRGLETSAMLDRLVGSTQARLFELVEGIARKRGRDAPASLDGDLADAGLSSVDMVNLMLAVEAQFDITIPQGDITPENFRSISAMERLIARLAGESATR
jgi:acyl carrier protein